MAYDWYDANGYLAPGPSIGGWRDVKPLLRGRASAELVETGATEALDALATEAAAALARTDDAEMIETLTALRDAARRADSVLILSDGVGHEIE